MMAADSFHPPSEASSDAFLAALALKWREMRDAPAPADAVARMWRSLCGDVAAARGLKAVYVAGGDVSLTLEAGRAYFGFGPDLQPVVGIRDALERIATIPGTLACVPWPEHAGGGQWWPMLNETRFHDLRIIAGWPALPSAPSETPQIAIVGRLPVEPSGDDETLATAHDDHWTADKRLAEVGIRAEVVTRARSLALIRIPEFIAPDDRRIDLARLAGLDGLRVIGVRPRP